MQHVLVYAPTAATRKLYHRQLFAHNLEPYRAKDAAELFLQIALFEIDTVVLVSEGRAHEFSLICKVLEKKYDHKRLIVVTLDEVSPVFERYATSQEFFDVL